MSEHRRVIIIGAGPGGIAMSHALLEAGMSDFIVLEKADEPGGTWHHNRYPGAECDVMSHLYSFSFALNPNWSQRYARQPEILAYMKKVVSDFGISPHVRLSEVVKALNWDQGRSQWRVRSDKAEYTADIVVSAVGMFNSPAMPQIAGIETYQGRLIHTADWPEGDMLDGLRVGVIGSAASAVQLIPEIAQTVSHLTVFQRTPIWVMPKDDRPYTPEDLRTFAEDPQAMSNLRAEIAARVDRSVLFDDPDMRAIAMEGAERNISVVKDPEVRRKLTPWLPYGSRRPIVSNYYYPTFNRDNVTLVTEAVVNCEPNGVRTADGTVHELDAVVCATGFTTSRYASVIDITGKDGRRLADDWSGDPSALLGIMVPGYPNFFMMYGPNTNNGSILTMLESQAEFIVRQMEAMDRGAIAELDVRPEVARAYNEELQQRLDEVEVWQAQPDGYYRGKSGRIVTQWPSTMREYDQRLKAVGPEVFNTIARINA